MPYTVDKLPDAPVIFSRTEAEFNMREEQPLLQQDVLAFLDNANQPLVYIVDLSNTNLSVDDIIAGTSAGARNKNSTWYHTNVLEMVFVSPDEMIHAAVRGLDTPVFNNFKAKTFFTFAEAVDYAKSRTPA